MNARQFLAVLLLFVLVAAFIILQGVRRAQREKYSRILDEVIRVGISNVETQGSAAIKEYAFKGKPKGYTWQQMAAVEQLYYIEQNGNVDKRSGEKIPEWLMKEYKKKYNADF